MYRAREEIRNREYQKELKALSRKLQTGEMTSAQYYSALEGMMAKYSDDLNKQEELEEMLFQLREERRQKELANRYKQISDLKDAGKITLQQELNMLYEIQRAWAKTEDEKEEVADQIRQKLLEIRQEEFDEELKLLQRRRAEDKITTEELIANLEILREKYADNLNMRKQMDEELYNAQRQLLQERLDATTSMATAILDTLKNQYTQQRDAEKDALKASQKAWKDWATEQKNLTKEVFDAKIKAIEDEGNAQLKALEDLEQAEDRAAKDEEDRRKIAELQLQIDHERDDETRYQLQKQLDAAIKSGDDRLAKQERDDQKAALKDYLADQKEALQEERDQQIENIDKTSEYAQNDIEEKLAQLDEYWNERLNTQKLRGEAERLLIEGDQDKIIELLKSYNPEYDAIGKSWGQKLSDSFGEAIVDIAVKAKEQFAQVQQVLEDSFRGFQSSSLNSPTSTASLNGTSAGQIIYSPSFTVQGNGDLTEAQFEELFWRLNRRFQLEIQ